MVARRPPVAYRDTEDNCARNGLWVVRPNGTGRHRVFPEPRAFAWSPDGKRLAVSSGRTDVFIVGVDGRQLGRLRLDLGVGGVRWSPDGDQLLLAGQRGNDATQILWSVRMETAFIASRAPAGTASSARRGWPPFTRRSAGARSARRPAVLEEDPRLGWRVEGKIRTLIA
jgi:dipeptidyl aminopeptidase/acylaminoacyl peptidase